MVAIDLLILPLGCLACGLLAAAGIILRYLPMAGSVVNAMLPYKAVIGLATLAAAVLSLFFPPSGPVFFGSLFPSMMGALAGTLLSLELLANSRYFARRKELIARIGNALLYLKRPIGLLAIFFGFCHWLFHKSLFF